MDRNIVTVFGSSHAEPSGALYRMAYDLGRVIAELGLTLCNGGYGGTMEAGARGAADAGGHTIGVTCTRIAGRGGPNRHIRQEIPTFSLFGRLETLIRLGRGYVVLPGGTGTLVELALTWELIAKGMIRRERPLIVIGDWWASVIASVGHESPAPDVLRVVDSVSEVREILAPLRK